jgi:hypothetical protein
MPRFLLAKWGLTNFSFSVDAWGWPATTILLISTTYQVARITAMSHHTWLEILFFKLATVLNILLCAG